MKKLMFPPNPGNTTGAFHPITCCRLCGNKDLIPILDLGVFYLTGVFPRRKDEPLTCGPLALVKCRPGKKSCGLLQLAYSYDSKELYGANYGYRSGLNTSMVEYLYAKAARIETVVSLSAGDLVVDIGSSDSTLLQGYTHKRLRRVGIDPAAEKFRHLYPADIHLIPEFFSKELLRS